MQPAPETTVADLLRHQIALHGATSFPDDVFAQLTRNLCNAGIESHSDARLILAFLTKHPAQLDDVVAANIPGPGHRMRAKALLFAWADTAEPAAAAPIPPIDMPAAARPPVPPLLPVSRPDPVAAPSTAKRRRTSRDPVAPLAALPGVDHVRSDPAQPRPDPADDDDAIRAEQHFSHTDSARNASPSETEFYAQMAKGQPPPLAGLAPPRRRSVVSPGVGEPGPSGEVRRLKGTTIRLILTVGWYAGYFDGVEPVSTAQLTALGLDESVKSCGSKKACYIGEDAPCRMSRTQFWKLEMIVKSLIADYSGPPHLATAKNLYAVLTSSANNGSLDGIRSYVVPRLTDRNADNATSVANLLLGFLPVKQ